MEPIGNQEFEVLRIVWRIGPCTVREVLNAGLAKPVAYTTVATVLERLHTKGFLRRSRQGAVVVYQGREEEKVRQGLTARLVQGLFTQDSGPAVATLVDAVESYDAALLDLLAEEIEAKRKARNGPR